MLRIGIITLSASDNCGSLLQTYALQQVIKNNFTCNVEVINFNSPQSEQIYNIFPSKFYKHPKKTLFTLKNLQSIKRQKKGYDEFRKQYLDLTENVYRDVESLKEIEGKYDILITGSDQVWNVNMTDYSDAFFIPWDNEAVKIAYATSLGSTQEIEIEKAEQLKRMLSSFSAISVREETGKETIQKLTEKEVKLTADPTLLISGEEWEKLAGEREIQEPYIFYYSWSYPDEEMNRLVEKFAKKMDLRVFVINSSKWYKYRPGEFGFELYKESGPLTFLNLMKHAEYVFVQSFHGAVFANLLKKRFFFLNENVNGQVDFRTKNIIGILHEEKQIVHDLYDIEAAMNTELTYKSREFDDLISTSYEFLVHAVLANRERII